MDVDVCDGRDAGSRRFWDAIARGVRRDVSHMKMFPDLFLTFFLNFVLFSGAGGRSHGLALRREHPELNLGQNATEV